jgi:hypothetical protein
MLLWRILRRQQEKKYLSLGEKCPILIFDFKQFFNSSTDFHKLPVSNFTEIRPILAGRRTDMKRLVGVFLANVQTRLQTPTNF